MNLQPLYMVEERLRALAIAGTGLMEEDFRLKRAVKELEPLSAAGAVFAKLQARLEALLSAPPEQRADALLDALTLADAILYTQGRTGMEGELTPLPPGSGTYVPLTYAQLSPLMEALTTSGSGRYAVLHSEYEEHPEYFRDYRILLKVIDGLGDRYSEVGELCAEILSAQGKDIVPLLKKGFDPAGGRAMQQRAKLIADAEEDTRWALSQLGAAKKDVRTALLRALGKSADNLPLLLELAGKERGKNREAVLGALGEVKSTAPELRAFWEDEIEKNGAAIAFLNGDINGAWVGDLIAEQLKRRLERALREGSINDAAQSEDLRVLINQTVDNASPGMEEFWLWVDAHCDALNTVKDQSGQYRWKCLEKIGTLLTDHLFRAACGCRYAEVSEICLRLYRMHPDSDRYIPHALAASMRTKETEEVYEEFSPMILTHPPLTDGLRKRKAHAAVLSTLASIIHFPSRDVLYLDKRWVERVLDSLRDETPLAPSVARWNGCDFGSERIAGLDILITDLTDPSDDRLCEQSAAYLRRRMAETGQWLGYCACILHIGKSPRGALGICFKKSRKPPDRLYSLWGMLEAASRVLPAEEVTAMIEELLASDWFLPLGDTISLPQGRVKDGEYPFWSDRTAARTALRGSAEQLAAGLPFPDWDVWQAWSNP